MKTVTIFKFIFTVLFLETAFTCYSWSGGIFNLKIQNVWYHDPWIDLPFEDTYRGQKVVVSEPQKQDAPYSGDLTILDSYIFPGDFNPYPISIIKFSAFANSTDLVSITMGEYIKRIDDKAFANCPKLNTVIMRSENPPEFLASNAFEGTDITNCTLMVPENSIMAYKDSDIWKDFGTIKGYNLSGIKPVSSGSEQPILSNKNGTVTISNISDTDNISVYNTGGIAVKNVKTPNGATSVSFDLPRGLYIIRVNAESFKIII